MTKTTLVRTICTIYPEISTSARRRRLRNHRINRLLLLVSRLVKIPARILMEKEKPDSVKRVTSSLKNFDLNRNSKPKSASTFPQLTQERKRAIAPSLVSLCLGVIGRHLEDVIADLGDITFGFPADIKMAVTAIARRRKLLNDNVVVSLADSSWEILDVSNSDVSDSGLAKVADICKHLRAVDISRCNRITAAGVSDLVHSCKSLETLRCGGCPRSEFTARRCLSLFKPKLIDVDGDSWEELDTAEIGHSSESLRWLVWPKIDEDSLETLKTECPRITVNPKSPLFRFREAEVPKEAFPDITLDDPFVKEVDPQTWAVSGFTIKHASQSLSSQPELSVAEKFRLAFVERDTRLAPKRAKNARQRERRAEREWRTTSVEGKVIDFTAKASKSLHNSKSFV